jgi:hypothetical protein
MASDMDLEKSSSRIGGASTAGTDVSIFLVHRIAIQPFFILLIRHVSS